MRTIDLLYQAYVDERMESTESGEEQEAIRQFRNICSKADNSLMKLQGDIWDSMSSMETAGKNRDSLQAL